MSVAILEAETPTIAYVALGSGDPATLAEIRRPEVALTQWWRPLPFAVGDIGEAVTIRLEGDPDAVADSLLAELSRGITRDWHARLAADAEALARRFCEATGIPAIALRLEVIETDACRRFHADYVPVRLITTYAGPGTDWRVGNDDHAAVHRIPAGTVALFKGRGSGEIAIRHRSPPIKATGERRLVLVIDPLDED